MDDSLNFTASDSLVFNLMKKMQKSQKILEEFSEELKSDNSEIMDVDDENGDEPHSSTMISQAKSAEPDDDDDIDEELLSAANCSNIEIDKVRKSINRLLNVHVPLDLNQCVKDDDEHDDHEHDDDDEDVDGMHKKDDRLRRRLDKLSAIYKDDDDEDVENNDENDRIVNRPKSIMREQQNFATNEFQPPKKIELRDRLKSIADSYYPVANKEESPKRFQTKISSPKSQPQLTKQQPPPKAKNENLFKSKSVEYVEPKKSLIEIDHPKPATTIEKTKTSVADLKRLFEKKMSENQERPELAPELLPVREKKRLFEKAIRQENEAKAKQYKCKVGRLPATWLQQQQPPSPPTSLIPEPPGDDYYHSPKRLKEHQQDDIADADLKLLREQLDRDDDDNDEEEESPSFDKSLEMVQAAVSETFKSIDEIPINDDDGSNDEEIDNEIDDVMELTFTAIDREDNEQLSTSNDDSDDSNNLIHRSSTRVDLFPGQSDDDNQSEASSYLPPEKPQRLFLYENEDDDNRRQPESEKIEERNTEIEPPLRTISFYREQQRKLREEQQMTKRIEVDQQMDSNKQMRHNMDEAEHADREQFRLDCQSKMIDLKNEITDHNRVLSQSNTALNLSLSMPELRNSDSRVEAERLLLISNEKIDACRWEIRRLQSMISNTDHYLQRTMEQQNISTGTLFIDHIKLPLLNEFIQERAKGKLNSVFHFICLVIFGPKVYVSKLLDTGSNPSKSYLDFDMGLAIGPLSEDFKVTIKVFALELSLKEGGAAGHKYRFANSPFKTIRRKLMHSASSASSSPAKNSPLVQLRTTKQQPAETVPAGNFRLIGYVKLTLQNVKANANKFYRLDSDCFLPVIDSYLTMNVSIKVSHGNHFPGFFDMKEKDESFWNVRYFRIQGEQLRYYRFGEEKNIDQPLGVINLKHCINPKVEFLKIQHRHLCRRSNSFVLVMVDPPAISNARKLITGGGTLSRIEPKLYFISSQSESDCLKFCSLLEKILHSIRVWERDAVQPYNCEEFDQLLSNVQ
ncbi:hypothetical protein DERP_014663 [Dermatophagoides pteronyssinus]|uniref:Anillin homology domain-containing protein n=1 Tax=Dermatophagoides pteronyssinus TaxID=6956 RepID=A0ABQ8JRJ2_DERPT|nr:hypothetical protein DERP_014663 [Dermatophagoides pteronyssinus]